MPDVALAKGWLSPVTTKKLETKFKKTQKNGPQKHTRKPRGLFRDEYRATVPPPFLTREKERTFERKNANKNGGFRGTSGFDDKVRFCFWLLLKLSHLRPLL